LPGQLPESNPDGPNIVVVGSNPTCPDTPAPNNVTFRNVLTFARVVRAASVGMVNVASRRSASFDDLRRLPADQRVGPRQQLMLREAFRLADLVVLASGPEPAKRMPAEWAKLTDLLAAEQKRCLVVASVEGRLLHPQVWPVKARRQGEELPRVVTDLMQWRRP
jgi:hypothetical protein